MGLQPKSALRKESYGVAIGYNVGGPLALISLRTPFEKMWVMERVLCRLRMPGQPLYTAELGSHDQPCLSSFSQGKHGRPVAACRRSINNKGTASPCLGLGSQTTRKATSGADAPSQRGTGLPLLQDAGAFLGTPNAIRCELPSLSFKLAKRTVLGVSPLSCCPFSGETPQPLYLTRSP